MSASYLAPTGDKITQFEGNMIDAYIEISPDSADDSVTVTEFTKVFVKGWIAIEALAGTCLQIYAKEDSTTDNKINFVMYNSDGGAATSFPDFRIHISGQH